MDNPSATLQANCVPEEHFYVEACPCPCGAGSYQMYEQHLVEAPDGKRLDVLNARCRACGATHEFTFDITHAVGNILPEVPSQIFDVCQWIVILEYLLSKIPRDGKIDNPIPVMNALVAVQQALLFFDPGAETPRADAFFHTREVPEGIRACLFRSRLESLWERLKSLTETTP